MATRNIVFSVLISVFLCSPLLLFGATTAGLSVPEWLSAESARYLSGGLEFTNIRKSLSIEGFQSKELQSSIEDKIGNCIPAKASAFLGGAAVQRAAISVSGSYLGFTSYPTYFGSPDVLDSSLDAMFQMPLRDVDGSEAISVKTFADKFAKIAADFPDKMFVIIVADNSNTSLANPAVSVSDNIFTTADATALFSNAVAELSNVLVIDVAQTKSEDYLGFYYSTDHHWNGWGAVDAYRHAVEAIFNGDEPSLSAALSPITDLQHLQRCDWLAENGSLSRNGLCLLNEKVNEPELPLADVEVEQGDTPPVATNDGVKLLKEAGPIASYDFYQTWYGLWHDSRLINTKATLPNSEALIICDSFGTAFRWVASTTYEKVETRYDIHDSRDEAGNLRETLQGSDCDTVFLVGRVASFKGVLSRFPGWLN